MKQHLKNALKSLPLIHRLVRSRPYQALRYWQGAFRHGLALRHCDRLPSDPFTRFYRNPHQFAALLGPALDYLRPGQVGRPLHIVVLACSTGAEPYSIASALVNERPDVEFDLLAGDINEELIAKCRRGIYSADEVFNNELLPDTFVERTFESIDESHYRIRQQVSEHVTFIRLDALDPNLVATTGKADILFLQNVLFNLRPDVSAKILPNALTLLAEKAVVLLDGVDLHQRAELTARYGLTPLDFEIEAIHKEVWRIRKNGWPGLYWGIEPYWPHRKDTLTRYATIYLRDSSST